MAGWHSLSNDELAHVLSFLPLRERLLAMGASRATHNAGATTPALWQKLLLGKCDERLTDEALSAMVRWAGPKLTHVEVLGSQSITSKPISLARELNCPLQFLDVRCCNKFNLTGALRPSQRYALRLTSADTYNAMRASQCLEPCKVFPQLRVLRLVATVSFNCRWAAPTVNDPPCPRCREFESCVECGGFDFGICDVCDRGATPWYKCNAPDCGKTLCDTGCMISICDFCEEHHAYCRDHFDAAWDANPPDTCDLCEKSACESCVVRGVRQFEFCQTCTRTVCNDCEEKHNTYHYCCHRCNRTLCYNCAQNEGVHVCEHCNEETCEECMPCCHEIENQEYADEAFGEDVCVVQ